MKRKPRKRKPIVKTLKFEWSAAQKVPTRGQVAKALSDMEREAYQQAYRGGNDDQIFDEYQRRIDAIHGRLDRWFGKPRKGGGDKP